MTRVCIDIDQDGGSNSGLTLKTFQTTIGDGSQLDYAVDHNLDDRFVQVLAYDLATGMARTDADLVFNSANRLTLRFDTPPANQSVGVRVSSLKAPAV